MMEEKLMEIEETINLNVWEYGINTYQIIEVNKEGYKNQYKIELLKIEIDSDTVMFINSDDDIVKYFLVSSVDDIQFDDKDKQYKLIFKNGGYLSIAPVM